MPVCRVTSRSWMGHLDSATTSGQVTNNAGRMGVIDHRKRKIINSNLDPKQNRRWQNPKSESRNPKQIQKLKSKGSKPGHLTRFCEHPASKLVGPLLPVVPF